MHDTYGGYASVNEVSLEGEAWVPRHEAARGAAPGGGRSAGRPAEPVVTGHGAPHQAAPHNPAHGPGMQLQMREGPPGLS